MFAYAVLCGITGNEESRVKALPGVDPPSLKTTIEASHPPITSLPNSSTSKPNQTCGIQSFLKTFIFGGMAASHWQEGALRI